MDTSAGRQRRLLAVKWTWNKSAKIWIGKEKEKTMFKFISDMIRKRREAKRKNYLAEWAEKEPELFRKWQEKERESVQEYDRGMQYAMGDLGGSEAHFRMAEKLKKEALEAERELINKGFDPDRYRD